MSPSRNQIVKWAISGAMHPIVLVEKEIRERIKDRKGLGDLATKAFPWPGVPQAKDLVAMACNDVFFHLTERDHYRRLWGCINERVFGKAPVKD